MLRSSLTEDPQCPTPTSSLSRDTLPRFGLEMESVDVRVTDSESILLYSWLRIVNAVATTQQVPLSGGCEPGWNGRREWILVAIAAHLSTVPNDPGSIASI